MKIKEVMTRQVEVIRPDATVQDAATKLRDLNIGSVPVCDGQRLLGMITDRDITIRTTASGQDPKTTKVSAAMSKDVIFCFDDQDVREAARMMGSRQIRRLPILDRDKKLVGIVAMGDLAVESGDDRMVGQVLEDVSEPSQPSA